MIRLPAAFLHLDPALSYPDPAWRQAMTALPASMPEPAPRRGVSRHPTPWALAIVGPNGAGKSTLYRTRLARLWPGVCFVNADDLSHERLGRHALDRQEAELGQSLVSERINALLAGGEDFIWETVFSHPSRVDRLQSWRDRGYQVGLVLVHPGQVDTSVARVDQRVATGGHPVPEDKIRSRFMRTPLLAAQASRQVDAAWWLDSSADFQPPRVVAHWRSGQLVSPVDDRPAWVTGLLSSLLGDILCQ